MLNVLIVGGAGYVGGALTDALRDTLWSLRVYDRLLYDEQYLKPLDFRHGDIRDRDALADELSWADVVVWLAAIVGDAAAANDPQLTHEINADSVEWLAGCFDRQIIFMSSCSVYGASDDLLTEDSPTQPLSLYAQSKLRAEKILAGHSATILRLGTLYGIADAHARIRLDLVVNALTARAFYLNEIKVFGGKQYRPLLHVKDVAAAIRRTIGSPHTGIFNLHHENLQIIKVAEAIRQAFPDVKVVTTEMEFEDQRNYRVVSDKAREMLGFSPVRSVSDGIRELHAVLKDGRIKNINNPRYSNANFIRTLTSTTRTPLGVEIGKRL